MLSWISAEGFFHILRTKLLLVKIWFQKSGQNSGASDFVCIIRGLTESFCTKNHQLQNGCYFFKGFICKWRWWYSLTYRFKFIAIKRSLFLSLTSDFFWKKSQLYKSEKLNFLKFCLVLALCFLIIQSNNELWILLKLLKFSFNFLQRKI